ncbi:hypothetical protein Pmani_021724 [Petrolisthes manimaculis]|uniref:Uncharacterized protein n=1 Tax=Petrolisthes manimaculis TaxID=1843537 RepID=A0AAE1PFG3_9EUCA|nr:hypothetical protein Pmani_021724 [Petrolisthes manimaculis]
MALLHERRTVKGCSTSAWTWLTSPMRNRQVRPQRLQVKFWSRLGAGVSWFFHLCLIFFRLALRESSKTETALWVVYRQTSLFAPRVDHWQWSMRQAPNVFLKVS